jgi:hypothetical protein
MQVYKREMGKGEGGYNCIPGLKYQQLLMSIFNYKRNCLTLCAVINTCEFFSIHECQYCATQTVFVAEILILYKGS